MFAVNVKFLISLLSRTVGPENRRLLRIVSFDITLGRQCPPSPRRSPLFSGSFILDQRQAWSRESGFVLKDKKEAGAFSNLTSQEPFDSKFKVNGIENIEQPRHKYRVLRKNSSSRRNVCNLMRKYFEKDFWNQYSRIFRRRFWVFQGLLLAICFVVVWILSSISSIFCIMLFGDRTIYNPNRFLRMLLTRGTGKGRST